jgi:hypothetical protein
MSYRYIRLTNPQTMIVEKINVFDINGRDVAVESLAVASSVATGYLVGSIVSAAGSTMTYRSKEKLFSSSGGQDNRRENNMFTHNTLEIDLGEMVQIKSIRIHVPTTVDSWKMNYVKLELIDANRRICAASEYAFHHHGRGEIAVNGGVKFAFDTYPTDMMFARSGQAIHTIEFPVSRWPRWNTIKGGGVHFEPKMNIDYPELKYMGTKFQNVGYRNTEIDMPYAAARD